MKKKRSANLPRRIGLPVCLTLTISTGAAAQTATEAHVEDVVVTAPADADATGVQAVSREQIQLRQSTPVASTIITQQQLEAAQITNLSEAQRLQPSLNIKFANVRNIAINIRGFGASSSNATDAIFGGSPVYLNGVYQPFVGQAVFNIPDLVGVEVLKGPQATAGGQDNTGGIVNITTALPSFTSQGKVTFQYGSYNQFLTNASVTGAIADSDKAAFRLSFFDTDQDGYLRSLASSDAYNGTHNKGAQLQFLLTPTNDLTALIALNYSTVTQACCVSGFAGVVTNFTNGNAVPNNFYQRSARLGLTVPNANSYLSSYTTNGQGWQNTAQDTYGISSKIDYNVNGYTFNSTSAFFDWDFHPHNGFSLTPGTSYVVGSGSQVTAKSIEQQFSITNPKGGPVDVTAGVFYFWANLIDHGRTANGPLAGVYNNTFKGANAFLNSITYDYLSRQAYDNPNTNEIAPFVQSVWHATPEFDVTTGLRYSYNAKSSSFQQWQNNAESLAGLTAAQRTLVVNARNASVGANQSWYAETHQGIISGLVTGTYKINPNVISYVTYSRGGRAGGPNPATGNLPPSTPTTVKAEELDNFEVGLKSSWFEDRLIANVAAFVMVDYNYIAFQSSLLGATPATYLANAKRAESRGVELDLRAKPIDGLTTYATLTYDNAYYGSFDNAQCPFEVTGRQNCDLTGKPLSLIPKWAAVVGGEYSQPFGAIFAPLLAGAMSATYAPFLEKPVTGYVGGDFTWTSSFYSDTTDSVYSLINSYGLLNLVAGLRADDGSWDLSAWAHNALNKHYYTSIVASTGGLISGTVGEPLTVGATLRARF